MKPIIKFLQDDEIKKIHNASLKLLNKTGVKIDDDNIKNQLCDLGCIIENERVKFKPELIEESIKNLKKEVSINSYTGQKAVIKSENVLSHSFGAVSNLIDLKTGEKRNAVLSDLTASIRIMNELEQLDMIGPMLYPCDIPGSICQLKMVEQVLKNSKKPIRGPGVSSPEQAKYIVELYNLFSGGDNLNKPIGTLSISPESPLYYPKEITDTMKTIISAGIPTVMLVAPIAGLTGPFTIAGSITQMNASILAAITIANLINPETPLIYGSRISFPNMKNGFSIWGLPEIGISGAAAVQLAHFYGMTSSVYGLSTSSCTFDNQSGYEKAVNGLLPILAGADTVAGFGGLCSNTVASFEQLVIDNEIFAVLRKVLKGLEINEDTLALDVINNVVNNGNFLEQSHTVKHLRSGEFFTPKIGFDSLWNDWQVGGKLDIKDKAQLIIKNITVGNSDINLPLGLEKEIDLIINEAYKHLVLKNK